MATTVRRFWTGCVPQIVFSDQLLQNGIWAVKPLSLIHVPIGYQRQFCYTGVTPFEWTLAQDHKDPTAVWMGVCSAMCVQLNAGHFCKVGHGLGRCRNEPFLTRAFRTNTSTRPDG